MTQLDYPIAAYHPSTADAACHVALLKRDGASGIVGTWVPMEVLTPGREVWTVVVAGQPVSVAFDADAARWELLARLATV